MVSLWGPGEESHWSASWSLRHALALEAPLKPAWDRLLIIGRQWRHDIPRIRAEVVDEVKAMIEESAGDGGLDGTAEVVGEGHVLDAG